MDTPSPYLMPAAVRTDDAAARPTPRLAPVPVETAGGRAKELLDELAARGGEPGPMARTMANAPALLRGYVDLSRAMKRSHIDRRTTERIALAAQEWIGCAYCLDAHTRAARELGLGERDIELARQGTATDPAVAALVAFGQQLVAAPSEVSDAQIAELRGHGYSDEQIAEVVGLVALQLLTGAFNLVAGLEPGETQDVSDTERRRRMSRPHPRRAAATGAAARRRCAAAA